MLQIKETLQTKRNGAVNKRKLHTGSELPGTIIGGAPVDFYVSEEAQYEYEEEEVL